MCCSQAPADGQITPESALAQQITKGQAREIMQKYMPVPEATVRNHCSVLVNIGSKHKQMLMQVSSHSLSCTLPETTAHVRRLIDACEFCRLYIQFGYSTSMSILKLAFDIGVVD